MSKTLYRRRGKSWYTLCKRMDGPENSFEHDDEKKIPKAPLTNPNSVYQPVARRLIDLFQVEEVKKGS